MTSILDNTSAMNHAHHECGGTILSGCLGSEQEHRYCDRCGAYSYDLDGPFPTGTDRAANRNALENGDDSSPDAEA